MSGKDHAVRRPRSVGTERADVEQPRLVGRSLSWIALVSILAVATAGLGWWTIPMIAAVWGAIQPGGAARWMAGLAAALSWGTLLAVSAARGPIWELSERVGGVLGLPGFALVLLTLIFPTLLAVSGAELGAVLRRAWAEGTRVASNDVAGALSDARDDDL